MSNHVVTPLPGDLTPVAVELYQQWNLLPIIEELKIVTKERGIVRFGDYMNYAQRDLIEECESQLYWFGRIRMIVLKARQIGISTAIEAVIFVLTLYNEHFQSLIVSHEAPSAEHLLTITQTYWDTYVWNNMHTTRYQGRKHLAWAEESSGIQIITAKNAQAGRSRTPHSLHASEVAFWDNAETLMTGLNNAIPGTGLTAIFLESTANGIGNYFHNRWTESVRGENEYVWRFYPWHKHPEYRMSLMGPDVKSQFQVLGELDEEETMLRDRFGIEPDRLLWRRWAIKNKCLNSVDKFHQEYPTTPGEAFLSTGTNVFKLPKLVVHYQPISNERHGRLIQKGNKVVFVDESRGPLTLFRTPGEGALYVIGGDPTHTHEGDYAVGQVFNRRTLEQVAVLRLKTDPIEFGRQLYLLGVYYNNALVGPEREGPGNATIGVLLGLSYPNVCRLPKLDHTPGKLTGDQYGWGTNKQTKPTAVSYLIDAITQPLETLGLVTYGFLIHDTKTFEEMSNYVSTGNGQYANANGEENDDTVMAAAIAIAVHAMVPIPFDESISSRPRPVERITRDAMTMEDIIAAMKERVPEMITTKPVPTGPQRAVVPREELPWDQWDDNDYDRSDR